MRKNNAELFAMILPTSILFFIFCYLPMIGLILAFRRYDVIGGLFGTEWVGLKYFLQFFRDPYFFRIIKNTVLLNLFMLLITFPAPIIFALLLNEIRAKRFKGIVQSISYIPHFISTVVVVGLLFQMFSSQGVVNQLIGLFGHDTVLFFQDSEWFRPLYIGSAVWEGMGWSAIIYFAALASINPELYEYASIEGAGRFNKIFYITLPCILPTITILLILQIGSIMNVGVEKVYLMQNPGIYDTADVISTYTYRRGILGMDYSYATAVGLFNNIINFCLLLVANKLSRVAGYGLW